MSFLWHPLQTLTMKNCVLHGISVIVLTSIGFDFVATMMSDGHLSNLKLFRRLLKGGDNHFSISNPYSLDKKIFLLFDTVHLFMCNNFLKYLIFEYPKFPVKDSSMQVNDDETILANSDILNKYITWRWGNQWRWHINWMIRF